MNTAHRITQIANEQGIAWRVVLRVADGLVPLRLRRRTVAIPAIAAVGRVLTVVPAALCRGVVLDVPVADMNCHNSFSTHTVLMGLDRLMHVRRAAMLALLCCFPCSMKLLDSHTHMFLRAISQRSTWPSSNLQERPMHVRILSRTGAR